MRQPLPVPHDRLHAACPTVMTANRISEGTHFVSGDAASVNVCDSAAAGEAAMLAMSKCC